MILLVVKRMIYLFTFFAALMFMLSCTRIRSDMQFSFVINCKEAGMEPGNCLLGKYPQNLERSPFSKLIKQRYARHIPGNQLTIREKFPLSRLRRFFLHPDAGKEGIMALPSWIP